VRGFYNRRAKKNLLTAFGLVWDGWHEREPRDEYANEKIVLRDRVIKRGEVNNYLTPEFYEAYGLWAKIRRWGWPHGPDWMNEPAALVDLAGLFDTELELLKERDRERDAGTRRAAGNS
jgi:hypothetical protein